MKNFKATVFDLRSVEFNVLADSKKEAVKTIKTMIEATDILKKADARCSVSFDVTEEEPCGCDCDSCPYDDEEEYLLDELY